MDTPIAIASDTGNIVEFVPVKYMLWLKLGVVQPVRKTQKKTDISINNVT